MKKTLILISVFLFLAFLTIGAFSSCSGSSSPAAVIPTVSQPAVSTVPPVTTTSAPAASPPKTTPPIVSSITAPAPSSTPSVIPSTTTTMAQTNTPSSSVPPTTSIPPGSIAASGQKIVIDLVAQNMAFDKSEIKVPAGAEVTINFTNKDTVGHNFAAYSDQSAKTPIFVGKIINGPATTTYTFTAPATPGSYLFHCVPHAAFMKGQLVVQ